MEHLSVLYEGQSPWVPESGNLVNTARNPGQSSLVLFY